MHAHAWVPCEAALCAPRSACKLIAQHALSVTEHPRTKSTDMRAIVGFDFIIANVFGYGVLMRTLLAGIDEDVEMLSRRYVEDVDVEVQCEGIIRTDKIKTKLSSF